MYNSCKKRLDCNEWVITASVQRAFCRVNTTEDPLLGRRSLGPEVVIGRQGLANK